MKKKLVSVLLAATLAAGMLAGCAKEKEDTAGTDKKEEKLTKVTLNEVAHSIFYAPMYVAVEEDYFKDEGIDLEIDEAVIAYVEAEDRDGDFVYLDIGMIKVGSRWYLMEVG